MSPHCVVLAHFCAGPHVWWEAKLPASPWSCWKPYNFHFLQQIPGVSCLPWFLFCRTETISGAVPFIHRTGSPLTEVIISLQRHGLCPREDSVIFKVLQKRFPYLFIFTVVQFRLRAACSVQSHFISVTRLCVAGFPPNICHEMEAGKSRYFLSLKYCPSPIANL